MKKSLFLKTARLIDGYSEAPDLIVRDVFKGTPMLNHLISKFNTAMGKYPVRLLNALHYFYEVLDEEHRLLFDTWFETELENFN
jgi:hypothetical protein